MDTWIVVGIGVTASVVGTAISAPLLRRAARDAGVELRPGEGWHSLRRKWANDRKGYPLKDAAKAGGWSSTAALEACYLQTDAATMLAVVEADSTQSTGHSGRGDSQEAA